MTNEADLIKSSQAGNLASFNALVEIYQGPIYNLALRMLGNVEAAEDVTQETFLSAYNAIKNFRGGSFKGWLYRIASNHCNDYFRKFKGQRPLSLDAMMQDTERPFDVADPGYSPEDCALQGELGQAIAKGLATLPADQRLVVILSDIQGFSYEEIAEATSSSLGTVKSRLSRGRLHLRDYLLQQGELLPHQLRH